MTESGWYLHDLESLKSRMKGNDVITSVVIPFSKKVSVATNNDDWQPNWTCVIQHVCITRKMNAI